MMEATMRFDAVVFDLDGTLTESGQGIARSAAYAIEKMGFEPLDQENLLEFVGPPLFDSFKHFCGMTDEEALKAIEFYRERHWKIGWMEAPVYEGIFELLFTLKKQGVHVSLASSKPLALCKKVLAYFGIDKFFDKVSAPDEKNISGDKCDLIKVALPAQYNRACMVGDRSFDMIGAKQAGVTAIGALYGYGTREELSGSGADEIAEDVPALRKILLGDAPYMRGRFITFEGSDGCGKSTQHKLAAEYLRSCGLTVVTTREPGGCPISERIRNVVLDVKSMGMTDKCEALLFAAARAQHVHDTILPALEKGAVVLCDRYVDSSIAYQGAGRELGDWVKFINEKAVNGCLPDMTLIFDISPEEAIARRIGATGADRIELSKNDFRARVHEAFIGMCDSGEKRFNRIDANGTIEQIQETVRLKVMNLLTAEV